MNVLLWITAKLILYTAEVLAFIGTRSVNGARYLCGVATKLAHRMKA